MNKYIVDFESDFEITIEIKNDEETIKNLHEINNFFSNASFRLRESNGCIFTTVAKMIAVQVLRLQAYSGVYKSKELVIAKFSSGDIEGYYPIDGSFGIKIVDIGIDFDPADLTLDVRKG